MPNFETNDDFLIIRSANRTEFREVELLLLSRAIPFSVEGVGKGIFVPIRYESYAVAELRKFQQENRNWPPVLGPQKGLLFRFSAVHLVMVAALALFHWWLFKNPASEVWMDGGMLAVEKVLAGEWSRAVTALTLHVDGAHLLGNFFGLLVFVGGVHQFTGPGISWFLVLLSGAAGNLGTALFYQSAHNAVGASTAVFSAVGLIGAFGVRRYLVQKVFRRRFFVPLVGALGLFAMLGTHPSSDVMAHIFGLFSGALTGLLLLPLPEWRMTKNRWVQAAALMVTIVILWWCWRTQLSVSSFGSTV